MVYKCGKYAVYKGEYFRLIIKSDGKLFLQANKEHGIPIGFNFYENNDLKDKCFLSVTKSDIESAFMVFTYATYKGFIFQIDTSYINTSGQLRILANEPETILAFNFNQRNDYEHIIVNDNDLENIWEKRFAIEGFPFKENEIIYLRKKVI